MEPPPPTVAPGSPATPAPPPHLTRYRVLRNLVQLNGSLRRWVPEEGTFRMTTWTALLQRARDLLELAELAQEASDAEESLSDEELDLLSDLVDASELEAATGSGES